MGRYESYTPGWYVEAEIESQDWAAVADTVFRYQLDSYDFEGEDKKIVDIILAAIQVGKEAERERIAKKIGATFTSEG
jgi:hypothetical protein